MCDIQWPQLFLLLHAVCGCKCTEDKGAGTDVTVKGKWLNIMWVGSSATDKVLFFNRAKRTV